MYSLFTKTQFAGIEIHIQIIEIFRHVSGKYFRYFKMIDEGQYWETGDRKILESQFNRYNFLLDMMEDGLNNIPPAEGTNLEDHIKGIAGKIHEEYRKRKF